VIFPQFGIGGWAGEGGGVQATYIVLPLTYMHKHTPSPIYIHPHTHTHSQINMQYTEVFIYLFIYKLIYWFISPGTKGGDTLTCGFSGSGPNSDDWRESLSAQAWKIPNDFVKIPVHLFSVRLLKKVWGCLHPFAAV